MYCWTSGMRKNTLPATPPGPFCCPGELDDVRAAEVIPDLTMPVLVYCRSGRRSFQAAQLLEEYGYEHIYDIGGLVGWPYGME